MTESIRQSFYGTGGFLLTAYPRELCHSALNPLANQREDTPSTMALLDRDVALKALPAAVLAAPDWLARFEREAKVLVSLNPASIGSPNGLEGRAVTAPARV